MVFQTLILGFGVGLVAVIPPGPVALSLIEVGVQQGRRGAAWGAIGIAGGDSLVATLAAILVVLGGTLPAAFFDGAQLVSAAIVFGLGAVLVFRPTVTQSIARSIARPGRTFFLLTALTPSVFGAWLAILAATPFASEPRAVALFLSGAMVASLAYHLVLGAGAGGIGHRLAPQTLRTISRVGGLCMIGFGVWSVV
jgi:threonine/homoserine/homoserine lactone efflux protein